jgi:hypothetical protein
MWKKESHVLPAARRWLKRGVAKTDETRVLARIGQFLDQMPGLTFDSPVFSWLKIDASLRWSFSMRVSSDGRVLPSSEMFNSP